MADHDQDKNNTIIPEVTDEKNESTVSRIENDEKGPEVVQNAHAKKESKDEEVEQSFSQTSQVSHRRSFWKNKASWMIVSAGVLFLIVMMFSHHEKEVKKEASAKMQNTEKLREAIEARIKREQGESLQNNHVAATQLGLDKKPMLQDAAYSKEMIARMSAPTSIYESGGAQTSANTPAMASVSHADTKEATFIGKGANQEFGNTQYQTSSVEAKQVPHPESTIMSGEMIHATLNVAMNSDLPGMVTATVTSPAYSYTGANELIPRGSRLIGQYSSAVLQGQDRIFIMWNRVVLPNGISVDINSPDTDQIGQSGEPADYINRHFWSRFGESILLSILSAGVSTVDVQTSDEYNSSQAYRMAIAESLQASAAGTLQQTISVKPTLVRYQGATINVFIAHDLSFYNVLNEEGMS